MTALINILVITVTVHALFEFISAINIKKERIKKQQYFEKNKKRKK